MIYTDLPFVEFCFKVSKYFLTDLTFFALLLTLGYELCLLCVLVTSYSVLLRDINVILKLAKYKSKYKIKNTI